MTNKEIIRYATVFILAILVVAAIKAQPPTVITEGFWFMKKPAVNTELRIGTVKFYRNYQARLQQLLSVPVGDLDMVDMAGIAVVWDQTVYDSIAQEEARISGLIASMGGDNY